MPDIYQLSRKIKDVLLVQNTCTYEQDTYLAGLFFILTGFAAGPNRSAGNGGGSDVLCMTTANEGANDQGNGTSFIGPLALANGFNETLLRCAYCQRSGATTQVQSNDEIGSPGFVELDY